VLRTQTLRDGADKQMDQLRWGLIGCGDIARKRVAPALRDLPECELVAVCRKRSELAASFARDFGARKWHSDWQDLINDAEVEAVYLATPVHLHKTQTIAAAEAGKHVLCEKPMAMNAAECDEMLTACRTNNVRMGVSYYRHFYPVVARIKNLLDSGELGHPILAQINAFEWFNPQSDEERAWLLKKDLAGGGPMFDFGCHRIEVLAHILGRITRVAALTANSLFDREVEDTATASFQFEGGTCGVLTVTHAACEPQDSLDIFGAGGSISVPVLNEGRMRVRNHEGELWESHPPATNFHEPLITDFVQAVFANRPPKVSGEIGRMVARIEEAIYSHAPVGLDV
jgi:predicted dehydrogenase